MITDAFDKSEVLFGPKDFYGEKKFYVISVLCRIKSAFSIWWYFPWEENSFTINIYLLDYLHRWYNE